MYYVYFMIINKTCFHNGTYLQTSLNLYNYLQIETCTEIYPQPVCKKNIIKNEMYSKLLLWKLLLNFNSGYTVILMIKYIPNNPIFIYYIYLLLNQHFLYSNNFLWSPNFTCWCKCTTFTIQKSMMLCYMLN